MKNLFLKGTLAAVLALLFAGSTFAARYEIQWGTIVAGGTWQLIGTAMLEDVKKTYPEITGSTLPSTTTANIMGVASGKFNVGFSISDTTAEAWDGVGYFKAKALKNIRNLATLYPMAMQLAVRVDSGINSPADLKGRRVSPSAKGNSSDVEAQRLISLYGLSYKDMKVQFCSFEDAAQLMIDGHLDAMLFTTAFPAPSILNVSSQQKLKLLSLPDDKVKGLTKFRGVEAYTFPGGLYRGVDAPVKTIASRTHIVVREDMPDEVAYRIVKVIAENFKRYPGILKSMQYTTAQDMAKDAGIPFHPGAAKYYKERGWLK
jgi:TRAP transporter TAXI family solute receptor